PTITCVVVCRGRGPATSEVSTVSGLFMRSRISGFGHLHQGGGSAADRCARSGTRTAKDDNFLFLFSDLHHRVGIRRGFLEAYIVALTERLKGRIAFPLTGLTPSHRGKSNPGRET